MLRSARHSRIPAFSAALGTLCVAAAAPAITFSVDFQSPTSSGGLPDSFTGTAIGPADVLTVVAFPFVVTGPNPPAPAPLQTPGTEIGGAPGAPGLVPGGLGIAPTTAGNPPELDALSYGRDAGTQLAFSVDEFAAGIVAAPLTPNVTSEGSGGTQEAATDVFFYLGAVVPTTPALIFGNAARVDGNGLAPTGRPGVGLIEPNPPTATVPDLGDNLDAFDLDTEAVHLVGAVFFSLDAAFADPLEAPPANSGTAAANGFSGADVLFSVAGGAPGVFIPGSVLGLDLNGPDTDDLDALVLHDVNQDGVFTAIDTVYFSVRRGSAVIGVPDSRLGVPIEECDVLGPPLPGGPPTPAILVPCEALGLRAVRAGEPAADDLDALDLVDPGPGVTFSVDHQGPLTQSGVTDSFTATVPGAADILTPALPGPPGPNPGAFGPLPPPGLEIGGAPASTGVVPGGLGILPGFFPDIRELDALSYGRDQGDRIFFSVDEFATGVPLGFWREVSTEGAAGSREASADVFVHFALASAGPPALPRPGSGGVLDGDGLGSPGGDGLGLAEPNAPSPGVLADPGDNLDAVDVDTEFPHLQGPVFFSLDAGFPDLLEPQPTVNTGTAITNGFSSADVLVAFPAAAPALAIPAVALGLDLLGAETDDLDALIFDDADGSLDYSPGDTVYFSVRRGSAVIGAPDSAFGVPIEEGDVLGPPAVAGGFPALFVPAESLGLATSRTDGVAIGDELDALDLPEPGALLQLVPGGLLIVGLARRRRR